MTCGVQGYEELACAFALVRSPREGLSGGEDLRCRKCMLQNACCLPVYGQTYAAPQRVDESELQQHACALRVVRPMPCWRRGHGYTCEPPICAVKQ